VKTQLIEGGFKISNFMLMKS